MCNDTNLKLEMDEVNEEFDIEMFALECNLDSEIQGHKFLLAIGVMTICPLIPLLTHIFGG